ncbi:hypothetical protein KGY79_06390 [Candidatus Bipolaricaulota bacterium]|nr:hypothetical protein [Candidatus Bipolaricaulota bacterium]
MKETANHIRVAGEFIRTKNTEEDSEEEVFEAIFEGEDDSSGVNVESKKNSHEMAFSLEIRIN